MMFAVMKHLDIMLGLDFHTTWPPWEPEPWPYPTPYFVIMPMCGTMLTAQMAPTAETLGMWTMLRGTDIGPLIPHVGCPSLLTPLDILFSSSASYFGPSSYMAAGMPVAAALIINVNLNLNCNWCAPLPTGLVLCFTTHYTGMSPFDVLFGFVSMGVAIVLDVACGAAAGAGAKAVQKRVIAPVAKRVTTKLAARKAAQAAAKSATKTATKGATKTATKSATKTAAKSATPTWQSAKPTALKPSQAKPTSTWKSATPSQAKPTHTWQSAKPSQQKPTGKPLNTWKSAKPSQQKPATPPQPNKWLPAKPNQNVKPSGPKPGDHRLPDPNKPPTNPLKKKPSKQKQAYDTLLETLSEIILSAPFTVINELTFELLKLSQIEEFGAEGEQEEKKQDDEKDGRKAEAKGDPNDSKGQDAKKPADSKED